MTKMPLTNGQEGDKNKRVVMVIIRRLIKSEISNRWQREPCSSAVIIFICFGLIFIFSNLYGVSVPNFGALFEPIIIT